MGELGRHAGASFIHNNKARGGLVYDQQRCQGAAEALRVIFIKAPPPLSRCPVRVILGGDMQSQTALLNGQLLQIGDDDTVPDLLRMGRRVVADTATGDTIALGARTYGFVTLPEVRAAACVRQLEGS